MANNTMANTTDDFKQVRIYYVLTYLIIIIFNIYGITHIKNIKASELIIFFSRIIIGYVAYLYLVYILIADIVIEFIIYMVYNKYTLNFMYMSVLGIFIGYYIRLLPSLDKIKSNPFFLINTGILSDVKSDILEPKKQNPYHISQYI